MADPELTGTEYSMSPLVDWQPKTQCAGGVTIITLTGQSRPDVGNMIASELDGQTDGLGEGHLLLDFMNVEYLSSAELGTLISLHKGMTAAGGRLTLFNLSERVYEILAVTHLQTLLNVCR